MAKRRTATRKQQGPTRAAGALAGYLSLPDYLAQCAGPFFPNRRALDWFIRQNRVELVEGGALILGEGRTPSIIQPDRFGQKVIDIRHRKSIDKAARAANDP